MIKLNPKTNGGVKMKLGFLYTQLEKAHDNGNEAKVIEIEKEIERLKQPIEQKVPDVSNDVRRRMDWVIQE